jgi:hypothetical protein
MTPLRRFRGSTGSNAFLDDNSSEDQTVVMEDDSATTSPSAESPSLSSSRPSRSSTSSKSSASSNASMISNSAPRLRLPSSRSSHHHSKPRGKPESRRLFDEDDHDLSDLKLSPPRALRPTLRSINLNHELQEGLEDPLDGTLSGAPTPFPTSRKRSAAEVRGAAPFEAAGGGGGAATCYGNLLPGSMTLSPHISPNSFLTMDGRFVQSKNPFSSPMMTEDHDACSMYAASVAASAANAPSMPVVFQNTGMQLNSHLPPRHNNRATLFPHSGMETFQKKYFFTGSPIHEDETMEEMSVSNYNNGHGGASHLSSSNASTGGSLTKVRRFNLSDDIVAASGQEISTYKRALTVDTTAAAKPLDLFHDPSPTDILSFPPPPTPVKAAKPRPKESGNFYNMIRRQEPATPSSFLRQGSFDGVDSKTPHPGRSRNLAPRKGPGMSEASSVQAPPSRFTNDFDVIGELGKGSFGCVYKVLSRLDGCMYAIKAAKRQAKGVSDKDRMLKEVRCSPVRLALPVVAIVGSPMYSFLSPAGLRTCGSLRSS